MKKFLHPLVLLAVCLTFSKASAPLLSFAEETKRRPNVLFIAVDDLRPELGCYGHKLVKSPNIDRLAQMGMRFDSAYCQQAICMSSRASVLSGYRPNQGNIYENRAVFEHVPDALTLNQCFLNHGYEAVTMGKVYHYKSDLEQGWSRESFWPTEGTWEGGQWYGRGYISEEGKKIAREHDRTHKTGRQGMGPAFESPDVPDNLHIDGVIAEHAVEELNRLKDSTFFMAVGFIKPHLPFNCPKRYWDLYDEAEIELSASPFLPQGAPQQALTDWGELRGYYGMPKQGPMPEHLTRKLIHAYYACTSYTDALVGKVLDELDRLKLTENTIIVLWGDHGWKLGDYGMWCKHTNFELDTRVPLIVYAPEMKQGGQSSPKFVELVDLYPTLCDLCGLELPAHLEGTSFKPLLDRPDRPWKKAAFSQFYKKPNLIGYSIRTEKYRYTEWQNLKKETVVSRELYAHKSDPDENKNVINEPIYLEEIAQLADMLHAGYQAALP